MTIKNDYKALQNFVCLLYDIVWPGYIKTMREGALVCSRYGLRTLRWYSRILPRSTQATANTKNCSWCIIYYYIQLRPLNASLPSYNLHCFVCISSFPLHSFDMGFPIKIFFSFYNTLTCNNYVPPPSTSLSLSHQILIRANIKRHQLLQSSVQLKIVN